MQDKAEYARKGISRGKSSLILEYDDGMLLMAENTSSLAKIGEIYDRIAFAGVGNPAVVMLDWKTGKNLIQHLAKATFRGVAWGIALAPDGMVVAGAGGSSGGQIYFWKADGKNEFHKLKKKDTCRDLHLAHDQTHFVTAHHDGHLRISKMAAKA